MTISHLRIPVHFIRLACVMAVAFSAAAAPVEEAPDAEPTREELQSADESLETVRRVCQTELAAILVRLRERYPGIVARQSGGRSKRNDYRNYQWISVKTNGVEYLITIHHNNIDLRTGNPHTQFGRFQFWKCEGPNGPHSRGSDGEWRFRHDNAWRRMPRLRVWDDDYSPERVVDLFDDYLRDEGVLDGDVAQVSAKENAEAASGNTPEERRKVDAALENLRAVEAKAMAAIVREAKVRHPEWKVRTSHGNSKVNDYRNYQWITIRVGDATYWISMVYNDLDESTGNTHTQYGRIQFWRDINKENGPRNEAGPHTKGTDGFWRFRADKQWASMPRLHLWDADYSSSRVMDLFEEFLRADP